VAPSGTSAKGRPRDLVQASTVSGILHFGYSREIRVDFFRRLNTTL
jgi:hypothetical protein